MAEEHLLLVDCSGFAYRAYYTKAPRYHDQHDVATGAVEIFISMMWHMLGRAREDLPTMGVAVFDPPGLTWRHRLFPDYKANRDPARAYELKKQFPMMKAAAPVLGLHAVERKTYEADDVIATLAYRARKKGIRVTIVSSDKDFAQCVVDDQVEIVDPMQRVRILRADVIKKFGVPPELVPDVQALAGDSVDGIPGLDSCGKVTAAKLIRSFGSLNELIKRAKECRYHNVRRQIIEDPARLRMFLRLTTLIPNVPGRFDFERYRTRPVMKEDLLALLHKLGASGRAQSLLGLDLELERAVEIDKGALNWWKEELKQPGQPITDEPQCGYFKTKLIRFGEFVPARIWREAEYSTETGEKTGREILLCHVGNKPRDARAMWPRLSMACIDKPTYDEMMARYQPGAAPAPPQAAVIDGKRNYKDYPTPSFKKAKRR